MKATLEFNMEDDHGDFLRAVHASEIYFALLSVGEMLRRWEKLELDGKSAAELISDVRRDYYDITGDILGALE